MNRNITALILIVLGVGIYFTVTQNLIDADKEILAVNDAYTSAIKNAQSLIATREKVQKEYNNISLEDRVRLDKMIPSSVDNIHLIVDISKLGIAKGFALKNLKADLVDNNINNGPTMAAPVGTNSTTLPTLTLSNIKVSFNVIAPYNGFIDLMRDLESSLRIMDITRLSVKATDNGIYDFNVEMNTYWLRQ
jgi:Tfp pilus assembly protein PilO